MKVNQYIKIAIVLLSIGVIVTLGIRHVPISIARLSYPDIALTIYDEDWYGGPYTISEITTHRWYEKGQFGLSNTDELHTKIKRMDNDLFIQFYQYKDTLLSKEGSHNQLCITQDTFVIDTITSTLFTTEYAITSNSTVDYVHDSNPDISIHDYRVSFKAQLEVTGVFNEEFVASQSQELYIFSAITHIEDYLTSRQLSGQY